MPVTPSQTSDPDTLVQAPAPQASPSSVSPPAPSEPAAPPVDQATPPLPKDRRRRLWDWLTFVALAVLVYLILRLWYCWLRPDPEFLTFTTGVAELLVIASFLGLQTEPGRKLAIRLDDTLTLGRLLSSPRRICMSVWLIVGVFALLLYVGSPLAARRFRHQGLDVLEEGRYSTAIQKFRQAASLVPGDAATHYNLATAYEAVHDYEQAIAEYQVALELDDEFWPVYNNLGRLHIRVRDDPDAALATLMAGQRQAEDPLGSAVIGKNIAWAYLEKELPLTSLAILEDALGRLRALHGQGQSVEIYLSESYQLEALAYEALARPTDARRAWQDSLGYALAVAESVSCTSAETHLPPDCLDAFRMVAMSREALAEATGGP
jgi:hypothetical protein